MFYYFTSTQLFPMSFSLDQLPESVCIYRISSLNLNPRSPSPLFDIDTSSVYNISYILLPNPPFDTSTYPSPPPISSNSNLRLVWQSSKVLYTFAITTFTSTRRAAGGTISTASTTSLPLITWFATHAR